MKKHFYFTFPFLFSICCFVGCSEEKPEGLPPLQKVALQFNQEGTPCVGASVSLVPLDKSPWFVGGSTDANGSVQLKTHGKYVGVPVGKYRITISKTEKADTAKRDTNERPPDMASMMTPVVDSYHLIDPKYASRQSSPLEIEVVAGKNTFDPFNLGEPVHVRMKQPGER